MNRIFPAAENLERKDCIRLQYEDSGILSIKQISPVSYTERQVSNTARQNLSPVEKCEYYTVETVNDKAKKDLYSRI